MTARRQENKGRRFKIAVFAAFAALAGSALWATAASAAATERVVVNRHTGVAIDGFDPVAYFTDKIAMPGLADVELADRGAIWRFRNASNRAAFVEHPEVYSPQFGGYDPIDVAKGNPVPGHAQFWLIFGERLYLFNRKENLDDFTAAPKDILERAKTKWPDVQATLSDY